MQSATDPRNPARRLPGSSNPVHRQRFRSGSYGWLTAMLLLGLASGRPAAAEPPEPPVALAVAAPVHADLQALVARGLLELPGFYARPLDRHHLARISAAIDPDIAGSAGRRLRRYLEPELNDLEPAAARRATSLISADDGESRLRVSAFARFQAEAAPERGFVPTDSTRVGLRFDLTLRPGLYFFDELYVADIEGGHEFADPLRAGSDLVIFQDRAYVALATRYATITFGRDRLAWGPGRNGSLLLSATARPFTHLRLSRGFLGDRFHAVIVNGVLSGAEKRYVAFHRLDWHPHRNLRIGLAEGARYGGDGIEPLYLVGIIPYTLVGRLLERDHDRRASDELVRNNVMWDLDATWRPRPGSELYAELLLDDLGTAASQIPSRIGYQLGGYQVGPLAGHELRLRLELARVWRYVYSVFYGADYAHEGVPLGYPLGPDCRHVNLRGDWLLGDDWTLGARVVRQERGENRIGDYWDPDDPTQRQTSARQFAGVVERQWHFIGALGFNPSRHCEAWVELGYARVANANHRAGVETTGLVGRVAVALVR